MFYIGLKRGFGHAERAAFLFGFFQSLLLGSVYFIGSIKVSKLYSKEIITGSPKVYAFILLCLVIGLMYFNSRYFVKTGRYRRVLDKYGSESQFTKGQKAFYLSISILLVILSLGVFIWSGISLSRYLAL